ncbi:hypothetical protein AB0A74_16255 [Saccharothrix sp. NPDC042600]|uniref:hypothetical protein n=1 Tax=Saccharothrix TaxID=2071 RepID=UPI00340405DB
MLVQVDGVRSSDGALLAEVKTSVGTVTVRWSEVEVPRVCQDERGIVFRGRLVLEGKVHPYLA